MVGTEQRGVTTLISRFHQVCHNLASQALLPENTARKTAMQLSSWRDRRSGVGHLMGRDSSPQYQHQPNSRRDSNAAEFLEGQEVRGWPPHGEGRFPPISASTQLQEGQQCS